MSRLRPDSDQAVEVAAVSPVVASAGSLSSRAADPAEESVVTAPPDLVVRNARAPRDRSATEVFHWVAVVAVLQAVVRAP